ncbi:MAG: hypothetical protein V3U26_04645 [Dehalococcoidia bacterium]
MDAQQISRLIDEAFAAYTAGDADGFVANFAEALHYGDTSGAPPRRGRALGRWSLEAGPTGVISRTAGLPRM